MHRRTALLASLCLLMGLSGSALAAQTEFSVSGRLGSIGAGVELGARTGHFGVRGGIHTFGWTYRQRLGSNSSEVDLRFRGKSAMIDLYPSHGGSFHVSGGIVSSPIELRSTGTPSINGRLVLNNHAYTAAQVGALVGVAKWSDVAPYLGLGWSGSMGGARVKAILDLGVAFASPTFALTASNATAGSTLAADVEVERARIQDDLDSTVPVYPVLAFGLRVGF